MTKDELGKKIDDPNFAKEIRCYGEDKFRNIIEEIYFEGMREGYNLAKYRLELLNRMPFGAADDFLNKNLEEIRRTLKLCEQYESAPEGGSLKLKEEREEGMKEGIKEGQTSLLNAIKMLRAGKTEDELLEEGIDKDTIEMAYAVM